MATEPKNYSQWTKDQAVKAGQGIAIVHIAHEEAIEYMAQLAENMDDQNYREMAAGNSSLEFGVGTAIIEQVIPNYVGMQKQLKKKLKVSSQAAKTLATVYLGRVIRDIIEGVNETQQRN